MLLQRCMALSTAVFVGETKEWIPELVERAKKLKVNAGHEADADLGPLIDPAAKERVERLIELGIQNGASCVRHLPLCATRCVGSPRAVCSRWMAAEWSCLATRTATSWAQLFSLA